MYAVQSTVDPVKKKSSKKTLKATKVPQHIFMMSQNELLATTVFTHTASHQWIRAVT